MKLFNTADDRKPASSSSLRERGRGERGFTLIEILISLAIMSIVTIAVYQLYISQYKTWISQDLVTEMQQNGRVAIDTMSRDLILSGYGMSPAIEGVVEVANNDKLAILYKDPNKTASEEPFRRVIYWRDSATNTLNRYELGKNAQADLGILSWTVGGTALAENVTELNFTYFKEDGSSFTPVAATLNQIYRIKVSIKVQTSKKDPVTKDWKFFVLSTDVRPRNIGIEGVASDTQRPSAPTEVEVVDPGVCGTLWVRWKPNTTDVDLAGYTIYYDQAANLRGRKVSVSKTSMDTAGEFVALTGLSPNVTYFISATAYDNSGNESDYSSPEISGAPATNTRIFAAPPTTVNDTTINVVKPAPATTFRGRDGTSQGWVELTWIKSVDANVTGYRIFRSTAPFTFASYPPTGTNFAQIAYASTTEGPDDRVLDKNATSFVDKDEKNGCQIYYYAILPVTCDTTLISYDLGDDNTRKAVESDYAVTYGDGGTDATQTNGQPGEVDSPATSDTAPNDTSPPDHPTIEPRAGWRRVAVTLTNPVDPDFAKTCVYTERNGALGTPNLDATKDANGCFNVVGALAGTRGLVPDASPDTPTSPNGVFTNADAVTFWHDSMTLRAPTEPTLAAEGAEQQTYAYKAVSFDKCGNNSAPNDAQETTSLCSEDPEGKPNAPTLPAVISSACTQPVPLSQPVTVYWDPIPSDVSPGHPSTIDNPWDLAGYRIFRSNTEDFSSATLKNTNAPYWCEGTCSYSDSSVIEGETYYFKIASTDCPYEKVPRSTAEILAAMNSDTIHSSTVIGPITPGQILSDEKCSGGGICLKDLHREVLTGVTMAADNTSAPVSTPDTAAFRHNTVTIFFENTSDNPGVVLPSGSNAGDMTIQRATVYWTNSNARLSGVTVGGGRSAIPVTTTSGLTSVSGTDNDITDATIPGEKRYVPIVFEFKDASNNPVDMRDDELRIILNVKNESTGTTTCLSYLTTTTPQTFGSIVVPFGPSVSAVRQNLPSNPTYSQASPGVSSYTPPSGSNASVLVSDGVTVAVSAEVTSNTTGADGNKLAISSVKLYYKDTAKTVTIAPANHADYTPVAMPLVSGDLWSASIPAKDGMRVWYYVVATDSDGNYDRGPEILEGAYIYDQKMFDVCTVTPEKPTALTASAAGLVVTLNWTAPTNYTAATGGGAINAVLDPITYKIFRNGAEIATGVAGTTYTDTVALAGVYRYTVTSVNSCFLTTPACVGTSPSCLSAVSATYSQCAGSSGFATLTVSPSSIYQGDPFTVTIVDCLAMSSGNEATLQTINSTSGFTGYVNTSVTAGDSYSPTIPETAVGTGTFPVTITTAAAGGGANLDVAVTDTIRVYYPYACAVSPCATVSVVPRPVDPCTNTPKRPEGGVSSVLASGNITVTWAAVTQNTDSSVIADLAGYEVYEKVCKANKPNCTGNDIVKDWFVRDSPGSGVTSKVYSPDQGEANKIYYFKVKAVDSCGTPNKSADSDVSTGLVVPTH